MVMLNQNVKRMEMERPTESVIYMAGVMFKDLIENYSPESLERFANDFKNLSELFEEQMNEAYQQGRKDGKYNINEFNEFFKTYRNE